MKSPLVNNDTFTGHLMKRLMQISIKRVIIYRMTLNDNNQTFMNLKVTV